MRQARWSWALGVFSSLALSACGAKTELDVPGGYDSAGDTSSGAGGASGTDGGPAPCVDLGRMDLVLAIDNSRSMADKQLILARTVPDLVRGIINPACLDASGQPAPEQPDSPLDPCPEGSTRASPPRLDVHIGVIDSSIGGHGADACPDVDPTSKECSPKPNTTNNDRGHLLSRLDPCGGASAPTYQNKGFLAWDPEQKLSPPGEDTADDGMGGGLLPTLSDMIQGVGQIGCGYESQLESVYRFLADPAPYQTIQVIDNKATPMGTDTVLLQQRAEFLRSDSVLVVIMLSDENDCSTKEYGQFYYVNQIRIGATNVRLPRARQECEKDPNDPCCKSCGQSTGNCPPDPTCKNAQGQIALYSPEEDSINLRCWDQKRRFGIDFLYPVDRYKQAFSSPTIANTAGELVPNPIFSDLNPNDGTSKIRKPEDVLVTGVVGVPWQDIARDKSDATKGYKTAAELTKAVDGTPFSAWDIILGDPASYVPPKDPFMIESVQKRSGQNPITGDSLDAQANAINGHEWTIANDDLQYACIFKLLPGTQRDCTDTSMVSCDCDEKTKDNPLCEKDPAHGNAPTLQVRAKAYPGIRQLSLLRSLGDQATVGSVCAAQVDNEEAADFGYRPALDAVLEWLSRRGCK
jgi:hypothetical protein